MRAPVLAAATIWFVAVATLAAGAVAGWWPSLGSAYRCGWLVLAALPLGALPLLMIIDLAHAGEAAVAAPLRLLLASWPVLAVLLVPVLIDAHGAYAWQGCVLAPCPTYEGFGARWFTHGFFALRSTLYLVVWLGLSLYFLRPGQRWAANRALAVAGLLTHLVVGTLAAFDWFMSLDVGHVSANYGVLVMSTQCAFALTCALLVQIGMGQARPARQAVVALLTTLAVAAFLQFVEYLVVWSANLPKEIAWYQDRATGGSLLAAVGPVVVAGASLALASERLAANRLAAGSVLSALLAVEFSHLVLLASPRGLFGPNFLADILATIVLGGVAAAGALVLGGYRRGRLEHG